MTPEEVERIASALTTQDNGASSGEDRASTEPASSLGHSAGIPGAGRVRIVARYRRANLKAERNALFVFGDNVSTLGRGGQAKECRGEPNAVGIPTKWHPTMDDASFFSDDDLEKVKPRIQAEFRTLAAHLAAGGDVVWPADGVGTGLAQLPKRAPRVHAYIERCFAHLAQGMPSEGPRREGGSGASAPASPVRQDAPNSNQDTPHA